MKIYILFKEGYLDRQTEIVQGVFAKEKDVFDQLDSMGKNSDEYMVKEYEVIE